MLFQTKDSFGVNANVNKCKIIANKINGGSSFGTSIEGFLLEALTFRLDSNWKPIVNVDERTGNMIKKVMGFAGIGLGKAGLFSTQAWNGGSYLTIEGTIRMINWGEEEDFKTKITALLLLASPQAGDDTNFEKTVSELLTVSPPTVRFETNTFGLDDMIVKGTSVEYSRELTVGKGKTKEEFQPLYADIQFTLESRSVLMAKDVTVALLSGNNGDWNSEHTIK